MAALDFTFERREELIRRDSYEEGVEEARTFVSAWLKNKDSYTETAGT